MSSDKDPFLFSRTDMNDAEKKAAFLLSLNNAAQAVKNGDFISYEDMKAEFALSNFDKQAFFKAS